MDVILPDVLVGARLERRYASSSQTLLLKVKTLTLKPMKDN